MGQHLWGEEDILKCHGFYYDIHAFHDITIYFYAAIGFVVVTGFILMFSIRIMMSRNVVICIRYVSKNIRKKCLLYIGLMLFSILNVFCMIKLLKLVKMELCSTFVN